MENASKALIIAGAILLSILLISLGIMVYNNARGTIDDANLDSEEAQAFNTKISQYCGNNKTAADMNALVDAIAASNGAQSKVASAERHYINVTVVGSDSYFAGSNSVTGSTASGSITYPSFSSGTSFKASYTTDATTGYIDAVTITVN